MKGLVRGTIHRQRWLSQKVERCLEVWVLSFHGLGHFIANEWEEYSVLGEGQGFSGTRVKIHFLAFYGTARALVVCP